MFLVYLNKVVYILIHNRSTKKLFNVIEKIVCMTRLKRKKNEKNHSGVTDDMQQATSISIYVCTKATLFTPCYLHIKREKKGK